MRRGGTTAARAFALLLIGSLMLAASPAAGRDESTPAAALGPVGGNKPAQVLIGERLEAGEIDYPTSLVYRAYALFGDPRLPASFAGGGSLAEDHAFFVETRRYWSELPKEAQDLLAPFIVRPTDSRSRFFDPDRDATATDLQTEATIADGNCGEGWAAKDSSRFPFKVWMHCTGEYEADMDAAVAMIEDFWERLVALMGPPKPDTGSIEQGGDTRIDFYFVEDENDAVDRAGPSGQLAPQAYAHAAPDEPFVGRTSSAFVVAKREAIYDPGGIMVLAHEFFHTLQEAHNYEILFGFKGSPYSSDFDTLLFAEYWFVEATAVWVESYLYRDTLEPDAMLMNLHAFYLQGFQPFDVPLYHSPRQWTPEYYHIYGAYVYFLFLEQEVGPQAIADLWVALEEVEADDFDRTLAIIDELLPFEQHFREFAIRNLNLDLLPGDPITPSFRDLDRTFYENQPPPMRNLGTDQRLTGQNGDPLLFHESIPSLAAHYYDFTLEPDVRRVTLDFSDLTPVDALDVDMLVKIRGGEWERRRIDPGVSTTLCRDNPADDAEAFYLVLTNHDLRESTTVRGELTVRAVDTPCA